MSGILKRLGNIVRSHVSKDQHLKADTGTRASFDYDDYDTGTRAKEDSGPVSSGSRSYPEIPRQVIEDLATFNLGPPGSLEAVRNARNREIKKYHSDKFMSDPEKLETSKEIMQIYNAAYDRLADYYQKKSPR